MFTRLAASFALAQSSWHVLRQDKKLIVFPFISGVACLLVLASFGAPFAIHPHWLELAKPENNNNQVPWWVWAVLFGYYFCNYFVIIFFNAALVSCALVRFNGGEPTLADGLNAAAGRLPQILAWALVSATVGVLLKVVENSHKKVGEIISAVLGTAWTVLTYFVVPVLVVEKVGPIKAVQRSMAILRRTWGEALVGRLGIGFFVFLLALPGVVLLLIGGLLLASQPVPALGLGVMGLGALYFLGWMAASAALNTIFLTALYQYAAHGQVPDGFPRGAMEDVF